MARLPSVFTLVLAAACSTAPGPDVTTTPVATRIGIGSTGTMTIRQSQEQVGIPADLPIGPDSAYGLLRAVYRDLGLDVGRADAAARIVSVSGAKVRRRLGGVPLTRYLDCGAKLNVPNAETYDIDLSLTSMVTANADGSSRLTTLVQAVGGDPVLGAANQVACTSLTALEARIADGVRQRAGLPVGRPWAPRDRGSAAGVR